MGGNQFNEDFLAPTNKYSSKTHPLGISREASNIFENPKQRDTSNRMGQEQVFTPKHDLSLISGGGLGNANDESLNLNTNMELDDMRNSLIDYRMTGPAV